VPLTVSHLEFRTCGSRTEVVDVEDLWSCGAMQDGEDWRSKELGAVLLLRPPLVKSSKAALSQGPPPVKNEQRPDHQGTRPLGTT
jgi:hypothetical protein